jgi:hypothetical protein
MFADLSGDANVYFRVSIYGDCSDTQSTQNPLQRRVAGKDIAAFPRKAEPQ